MLPHHRRVAGLLAVVLVLGSGLLLPSAVAARSHRPVVTQIDPGSVPIGRQVEITLRGRHLAQVEDVLFGKRSGTDVTVIDTDEVRVTTPRLFRYAPVPVRVVTADRRSRVTDETYLAIRRASLSAPTPTPVAPPVVPPATPNPPVPAAPTATALSPVSGPAAGGTTVTVTGSGFVAGGTTVTIGGNVATAVNVTSSTSLSFITPAHLAGKVDVAVTTSNGSSGPVPGGYTYLAPPTATSITPSSGPTAGGSSVTVTGSAFVAGDTSVTIGGVVVPAGSVTVNSATSLTFTTPAHASGNVAVTVATSGGTSNTVPGGYTYSDAPTIVSITPNNGSISGGTTVTASGSSFAAGGTTVTLGGVAATNVNVINATTLTFVTPAHASGSVDVVVTTSAGSSTLSNSFTYVSGA